jgi:hypothetical protein
VLGEGGTAELLCSALMKGACVAVPPLSVGVGFTTLLLSVPSRALQVCRERDRRSVGAVFGDR